MKKIIALIVVLLVVAAVVTGFAMRGGEPEGLSVQTEPARVGALRVSVTAPGTIRAEHRVSISARTSARIIELAFDEGDVVEEGDVLVRLDDVDARAQVRSAEAGVRQASANLSVARARLSASEAGRKVNEASLAEATLELERVESLLTTDDVSRRAVEAAKATVERLRAQVRQDELQLEADEANLAVLEAAVDAAEAGTERAQQQLDDTVIRSPLAGTVTRLNAEVGEVVVVGTMNNAGTVILEVADLSRMICVAEIDEANITSVELGQTATVRSVAYDDQPLTGTVSSVALAKTTDARSSDGTGHYEVEITLDRAALDADDLRAISGLTADVEVETRLFEDVLLVPSQSVVGRRVDELPESARQSEALLSNRTIAPLVYAVVDGKAQSMPVRTGESDVLNTIIEAGLDEGTQIIVGPFKVLETIRDGRSVTAKSNNA
ncbi:MAG: efflux RND transporter periplasmic adaptor subunit, partial [Planctomycetota bacterium]